MKELFHLLLANFNYLVFKHYQFDRLKWYLAILNFYTVNCKELLIMYLLAIFTSYQDKFIFIPLPNFLQVYFLISLYIKDTNLYGLCCIYFL